MNSRLPFPVCFLIVVTLLATAGSRFAQGQTAAAGDVARRLRRSEALPRIATWVKLADKADPAAKPLLFLNTHFDHKGHEARRESAALLRRRIAELGEGCRVVVTGGWNRRTSGVNVYL